MKFYLCQTPEGPRYARTQADAKALDKNFTLVEYPVDQGALVERFNELLSSAPRRPITENDGEPGDIIMHDGEGPVWVTPPPPPASTSATALMNRPWEQIGIEEWIFAIPSTEAYRLDNLQACIDVRRAEIAKETGG